VRRREFIGVIGGAAACGPLPLLDQRSLPNALHTDLLVLGGRGSTAREVARFLMQ
jgi:hypothetical protein